MQPPAVRWDRRGLGVIGPARVGLPRTWGTNGRKEAARTRQTLSARMENKMAGGSQRAQSGHKTGRRGGETVISDKALRQMASDRSHRVKGVRVSHRCLSVRRK